MVSVVGVPFMDSWGENECGYDYIILTPYVIIISMDHYYSLVFAVEEMWGWLKGGFYRFVWVKEGETATLATWQLWNITIKLECWDWVDKPSAHNEMDSFFPFNLWPRSNYRQSILISHNNAIWSRTREHRKIANQSRNWLAFVENIMITARYSRCSAPGLSLSCPDWLNAASSSWLVYPIVCLEFWYHD